MNRFALLLALLIAAPCYGQPGTGYATATPDAPGTDGETGFSFVVDLSDMPTEWWTAADDADATKGRVYRNDGTTELAVDWVAFSDSGTSGTGFIRFKDDMAASPTTYRIYPPVSGNSSVAASATYGSDNAYDASWAAYYPLSDGNDRTGNGNNLTAQGGLSFGGTSAKVGNGTDLEATNSEYATFASMPVPTGSTNRTFIAWVNPETVPSAGIYLHEMGTDSSGQKWAHRLDTAAFRLEHGGGFISTGTLSTGSFSHVATVLNGTTLADVTMYIGGASSAPSASSGTAVTINTTDSVTPTAFAKFTPSNYWDGIVNDMQFHNTNRTDEWINEEYKQTNDNTAYWSDDASSGWTWTAGSGGNPLLLQLLLGQ